MNIQDIKNGNTEQEIRRMAIAFARQNPAQKGAKLNEIQTAWMGLMSDIHGNGKQGDYATAIKLGYAISALN